MQFNAGIITVFAGFAAATPLVEKRALCSSSFDTAQCCELSIDGLAVVTCDTRMFPDLPPFCSASLPGILFNCASSCYEL
jgi:hypothetical protein